VQDFLLNAESLIFNLQLIAGDLPVSFSMPLSALVSTHVFAQTLPEISRARVVTPGLFHFYSFLLNRLFS
jgi:hypothetical protein